MKPWRAGRSFGIAGPFSGIFVTCLAALGAAQEARALGIEALSSRAELVSGGDALVRISGPELSAPGFQPAVTLDGKDVAAAFKLSSGGELIGLVSGLHDGKNELTVRADGKTATLTLVNHPAKATLFAGPLQEPFVCENEVFGLQPATDASCAAPSRIDYFYRNRNGEWKPFSVSAARPTDIAMTTTTEGREVPLIVRQEKGVINRAAYLINILHDPAAGPLPTAFARSTASGWNGKLIYSFGGGVQANYHMGRGFGAMTGTDGKFFMEDLGAGYVDAFITRGYAIATGSLNVMGTNNDDVKSAETATRIKEHFIKEFGPPLFTIGHGPSGGSMQQHLVGNNYPGLLDGIMPGRSYPDPMTFLQPIYDCELLEHAFNTSDKKWTDEQKGAIAGKFWGYCASNGTRYPNARIENCDASVKKAISDDPRLRQRGVRCTYQDNLASTFGTDPKTGFARNPFDNVGVQYGLAAFNDHQISFEQFLEVNTRIGGFDIDGKVVPTRMTGDEIALARAYATGRVNNAGLGLAGIPIIDIRSFVDGAPPAPLDPLKDTDVHDGYHSAETRARLIRSNGNADNHVMLTVASVGRLAVDTRTADTPLTRVSVEALGLMDLWLTGIAKDASNETKARKVALNKPARLVDACYPAVAGTRVGITEKVTDAERCRAIFRFSQDARLVAGAPKTNDVFKCRLKPLDPADYKPALTADQIAELRRVFPDGVCDYQKPGIGQVPPAGAWVTLQGNGAYTALDPLR